MTKIFLNDAKVYLATVDFSSGVNPSERRSAVVIHADLSALRIDRLAYNDDECYTLKSLFIDPPEISSEDNMNPMLDISVTYQKSEKEIVEIGFRMPMQFFAISLALSKLTEQGFGGAPMLMIDSNKMSSVNPAKIIPFSAIHMGLAFDPRKELEYTNSLAGSIHPSVMYPLVPQANLYSTLNGDSISSQITKSILGHILRDSMAFSRGEVPKDIFYPNLADENHNIALEDEHQMVIPDNVRYSIFSALLSRIAVDSPVYSSAFKDDKLELSLQENMNFNHLFSELDFGDDVRAEFEQNDQNDTKRQEWQQQVLIWNAPASESWHPTMVNIYSFFNDEGTLSEIHNVINLLREKDFNTLHENYDSDLIRIGVSLYMVMQARKKSLELGCEVNEIIDQWVFSTAKEEGVWQYPQFASEIALGNFDNFNDWLVIENQYHSPAYFIHLGVVVCAFAWQWMGEHDIEVDEFIDLLQKTVNDSTLLENMYPLIRSHLENIDNAFEQQTENLDPSMNHEIDVSELSMNAMSRTKAESGYHDFTKTVPLYSLFIAKFAEVMANYEGGDDPVELEISRQENISEILYNIFSVTIQ